MSEEDKSGSEGNSCGYNSVVAIEEIDFNETRVLADMTERLKWLAATAEKYEDKMQRLPVVVTATHLLVSCQIYLPCGHVPHLELIIPWENVTYLTEEELLRCLKRLLKLTGEAANTHTAEHMKG